MNHRGWVTMAGALVACGALPFAYASATKVPTCRLSKLGACKDVNGLMHDRAFTRRLRTFAEGGPARLSSDNLSLIKRVMDSLGGPPDPVKLSPNGARLFAACRYNSCHEKAAVVVDRARNIDAIALIYPQKNGRQSIAVIARTGKCDSMPRSLAQWFEGKSTSKPLRSVPVYYKGGGSDQPKLCAVG